MLKSAIAVWSLALVPFLGTACKTPNSDSSRIKADFTDAPPEDGQTWTEARTVSLNEYAQDLLTYGGSERNKLNELQLQIDESFRAAGIRDADPLSVYTLKLGPAGECFHEGRRDYDLWWNSHRDQIRAQIEQVAYFLRDYHYRMLGRSQGPFSFREVVICPEETVGSRMLLEGYKLYIGVPYAWGKYVVIPNKAAAGKISLESLWSAGTPLGLDASDKRWWRPLSGLFDKEEKARRALQLMWKLFNPLSHIRVGIRKTLHENSGKIAERIGRFRSQLPEGQAAADQLRGDTEKELIGSDGDPAADVARTAVDATLWPAWRSLDADGIRLMIDNWRCQAAQTGMRADIEDDALGVMQRELRSETNTVEKDVTAGLVAVVNHHRIGVMVQGAAGSNGRYGKFIGVQTTRQTNVSTRVRAGLVAVDTSDDISVDLGFALDLQRTIQSAAFETALRAALGGRRLCQGQAR